jgi:murein L,D-transpeptidase YafK
MLRMAVLALTILVITQSSGAVSTALPTIDRLVVFKSERKMLAVAQGRLVRGYRVALGREPTGTKRCQGDQRTPEGSYAITRRIENSEFYRALYISYPSAADIERAQASGCPPGGSIEIHGLANSFAWLGARHLKRDWTAGCIAVTNEEMDELMAIVPLGTRIDIYP